MPLDEVALIEAGWTKNLGRPPNKLKAEGKRVSVILANGMKPEGSWAASGRNACRWTLEGNDFDIAFFREAK